MNLPSRITLCALGCLLVPFCVNAAAAPARSVRTTAKKPTVLKLRRHVFPDVTMGVPAAYSILLPAGWKSQGKIEWQPVGSVPFPQQKIEISSPQRGHISFEPLLTFTYTESNLMGAQGTPAPQNFPQWLVRAVAQSDPKLSNVQLVRATRDVKTEAFLKKIEAATGGGNGLQREVYIIVMDYTEAKVRRREEVRITYARFPAYVNGDLKSQMWSIAHSGSISAPATLFAAHRQSLLSAAGTLLPVPAWHIRSQAIIAEMSRRRAADNWALIRERGRQISRLSDAQYEKYKKDMAGGDAAQRIRINTIRETDDFKDVDGNIVNLPAHYSYIFSDGKGNYVLSNNSQDRPGSAWQAIRPRN